MRNDFKKFIIQTVVRLFVVVGRQIAKFSFPLLLLLACFGITLFICWNSLTIESNFSQVFEPIIQPPPGLSIQIKSAKGDKAILGYSWPKRENSSEKLAMTPRTKEQIQENLRELDPQQWQVLTKLPSPIFRYDLSLINCLAVPNNSMMESVFLVTAASGDTQRVVPGQEIALGRNLQIEDIGSTLALTNVDLVYGAGDFGMYWNRYDEKGQFISQATGTIVITPTLWTGFFVFLGDGLSCWD